jgi:oxygen-independent coproporphyrinogen-3 oxidase
MLNFTTLPPLSLYIHYPWCVQKCPYCDFNSHALKKTSLKSEQIDEKQRNRLYVNALIQDLESELPAVWGRTVQSIFIGGGTPSLITPEALQSLLSQIRARIPVSPLAEITMEANPGAVDQYKFAEFHSAGINRLSLGVQTFNDQLLTKIGRIHNAQQARQAIECAQNVGFNNINLDLMYALPGQSIKSALSDVQEAINFNPTHISHYQLTIEANTAFAKQPPKLPDDDHSYTMQLQAQALLAQAGFQHYEVSAYARSGKQCQHNLNYWQFGDYLGIGAGAHGKISNAAQQNIIRRWKNKHPQSYIEAQHVDIKGRQVAKINNSSIFKEQWLNEQRLKEPSPRGQQQLSNADIGFEFMLNATRLVAGFERRLFSAHTGLSISQIEASLQKALQLGLIECAGKQPEDYIKPTARGLQYLNELQELFL